MSIKVATQRDPKYFPEFKGFVSGIVGSWCGLLVGQPFDIIKVRIQNNGGSAISTISNLVKNEGAIAFWKGSLPPFIGLAFGSALSFGTNENAKRIISGYNKSGECLSIPQHALCGSFAGLVRSFISTPVELLRIKMQVQGKIDPRGDPLFKNSIDCFKHIYKNYGLTGLFKGYTVALPRELIGMTLYFTSYQYSGRKLFGGDNKNTEELEKWQIMICGGLAGYAYWIVYPIDVIKSKIQSDSYSNPLYKNIINCIKETYYTSGVKGFYRGFLPCFLRAAPANAAILTGFETTMSFWGRDYR